MSDHREPALSIGGFIRAMTERFKARTDLSEMEALAHAAATLEVWDQDNPDDLKDPAAMTEGCAHDIVDSELEHWEADAA